MASSQTPAIEGIRLFLWDRLKKAGLMDATKYARTPLVPVQEAPDFIAEIEAKGNPPYIIYNWTTDSIGTFWMMPSDQMVFLIYSPDMAAINDIVQFMSGLFRRYDDTASEVNSFIAGLVAQRPALADTIGKYSYKTITLSSAGGPLPFDQEAARQEALVSIRVTYTQLLDQNGMPL